MTDEQPDGDATLRRLGVRGPDVIDPVFVLAIGNELDGVDADVTYDLTADGRLVRIRRRCPVRVEEDSAAGRSATKPSLA